MHFVFEVILKEFYFLKNIPLLWQWFPMYPAGPLPSAIRKSGGWGCFNKRVGLSDRATDHPSHHVCIHVPIKVGSTWISAASGNRPRMKLSMKLPSYKTYLAFYGPGNSISEIFKDTLCGAHGILFMDVDLHLLLSLSAMSQQT